MLFEPRVVVRDYEDSWGRRKIDLAELYDLRANQGLTLREVGERLGGVPRATLIDNLHKAMSLFENRK